MFFSSCLTCLFYSRLWLRGLLQLRAKLALCLRGFLRLSAKPTLCDRAVDLQWVACTGNRVDLTTQVIGCSCAQSLDYPKLTELRQISDILTGHHTTEPSDPSLCSIAMRDANPIAVFLLSRLARQEADVIVCMGLAQVSRGTSVADDTMRRAMETVGRVGAK